MPFEIHYSPRSKIEFEMITEYISEEFGIAKAFEVSDHFKKIVGQLANNPYQFPYFNQKKNIRRCVISHQTTLFYRINEGIVDLISFRSNWMNPKSRNL